MKNTTSLSLSQQRENLFVSLNIAKKLKKAGFKDRCLDSFYRGKLEHSGFVDYSNIVEKYQKLHFLAPTISQALDFIREKGSQISVERNRDIWNISITKGACTGIISIKCSSSKEAYEFAMNKILNSLIKK